MQPPQEGTVTAYGATGTPTTEQLLWAKMDNIIALPEGALTVDSTEDRATVGQIKVFGLNLTALPRDTLYQLEDEATAELCAREGRAVKMLNEQWINIKKLSLQCDEALVQNQHQEKIVEEACHRTPELEIATNLLVGVRIHKLASGFHEAKEEATRIQLDLNL